MIFRFKNFRVYQDSKDFLKICKDIIDRFIRRKNLSLSDQIERALISIILNIAEGSGGESDAEFSRFISIAIKSTYEVVAGFDIAFLLGLINEEAQQLVEAKAEILLKELCSFRNKLKS